MGYAATHGRKCAIVIPHTLTTATLTNFPVCFTVANLPSEMFDSDLDPNYAAKSDGSDIRFSSDADGDSPLNVEIERFGLAANPANGFAEIWVRIPSFSYSVDTTVYVWYNDPDATAVAADDADEGSEGVWDANFKGVWHLQTSSGGVTPDSTANGNDGTLQGSITIGGSAGLIGNSTTFDGSDDHIDIASALVSAAPATLTAWLKATAATAKRTAICINDSGTTGDLMRLCENDSPDVFMAQQYDGSSSIEKDGTTALTETATWHKADAVFANSSTSEIFVNGASEGSASGSVTLDTMDHTCIGALHWSGGNIQHWLGDIDEVRISSVARSDEWLAAEYAVINSIGDIEPGTPESPSGTNTGTGALTTAVNTASGSGVVTYTGAGTPAIAAATASGTGIVSYIAAGALTIAAAICSGTGSVTYPSSGTPTTPAATASGSGTVTYTGSGTPSTAAVTASGSGTSAGSSTTTTNQAAITANRSIGQEDYNYPGKTGFEAAFAKITLPDLTGYTLTAATFKARLFSGSGPGTDTNCTIYAKVASNAWDESSGVSTLNTLESEFNLVSDLLDTVAVSETGGTEFEFDVLGDATHGLLGAYTANSNPGAITIMLRIPVIGSITSDFAQTSFLVGDEKFTDPYRVFYSRSDATYYPRITLEYTATGANEGTGALTVGEATASGSGVVTYTATGALTTPVTTAQGNDANVGSGTPTTPQAIVTGVGAVIYTASGTPAVASITASGLAATTYTGTGALVTPKPTIFGIYDKSDLVIPLPTVSGSGAVTNQNIGSLSIPVTTVSGTGSHSLVTTDPDTGALTGLNRNIASYSWKSINAKGDVETRRAFQRLDMAMQEIVTNVNNDLTNIVNGTTPVGVDLSELEAAIDALETSVSALQTTSTDHETRIEALEGDAGEVIAGVSGTTRGVFVAHNGAGGNTPAVLKLESRNGTYWYVFVADDGTLRVHSSLPANNNDGTIVGLQN